MRVAFNIVFASDSKDVRSDDEEDGVAEEEDKEKGKAKQRGKKAVDGGLSSQTHAQGKTNGLNPNTEDKTFAEVLQQGSAKKDL